MSCQQSLLGQTTGYSCNNAAKSDERWLDVWAHAPRPQYVVCDPSPRQPVRRYSSKKLAAEARLPIQILSSSVLAHGVKDPLERQIKYAARDYYPPRVSSHSSSQCWTWRHESYSAYLQLRRSRRSSFKCG